MGNRLTRIYTRTGDKGATALATGVRIAKNHPRIEAIGAIDELNSHIGLLLARRLPDGIAAELVRIQHDLFNLGGELGLSGKVLLSGERVGALERSLDRLSRPLPPLREFILPGGGKAAGQCHVARAVCRRAERRLLSLAAEEGVSIDARKYLNRLSDWLFVCARALARASGAGEVCWRPEGGA